jgi:hypothetical protein
MIGSFYFVISARFLCCAYYAVWSLPEDDSKLLMQKEVSDFPTLPEFFPEMFMRVK